MLLSGSDLASYIKVRHRQQVAGLQPRPKLVDIHASSDPGTEAYLKVKSRYATDIGVDFEVLRPPTKTEAIMTLIKQLNADNSVHGFIIQLPLPSSVDTNMLAAAITPAKDVDGLGPKAQFDQATPTGILWLLAGYGIDYKGKVVTVVGQGRLVGAPLAQMLEDSGAQVVRCDIDTKDLPAQTLSADIVVSATGRPGLIKPGMVRSGAVVIDAAGDVDPRLQADDSLKITPTPGGVGPMTVAALFDNLIRAAQNQ